MTGPEIGAGPEVSGAVHRGRRAAPSTPPRRPTLARPPIAPRRPRRGRGRARRRLPDASTRPSAPLLLAATERGARAGRLRRRGPRRRARPPRRRRRAPGCCGPRRGSTAWPPSSTSTSPAAGARLRRAARPRLLDRLPADGARAPAARSPTARPRATRAVARAAGSPRAVRAVGTACATNPLPLVVPCHRVVRSDGTAGRYRGGEAAKRRSARSHSREPARERRRRRTTTASPARPGRASTR